VQRKAEVNDLFTLLRPSIGAILRDWTAGSASGNIAPSARARAIDAMSAALMDLAAAPASLVAAAERACERVAVAYGREICVGQLAEQLVFEECNLIRHAIWHYVQRLEPDDDRAAEAIAHVDAAITLATVAALRGYHGAKEGEPF
jgi:hypothetical protein